MKKSNEEKEILAPKTKSNDSNELRFKKTFIKL